ncbi:MAG: Mov34/MPN/PAD-1 family protein [Chitinophagales bacterium]
MILKGEKIGLSIEVDNKLLNSLIDIGKDYYPNEYGGFLIGYYSNESRHLHVTDTILPKDFKASKYSFERSSKGITKELVTYYEETPQKIYVGEWHTHPNNSPIPSMTDISAMNAIVGNQESCLANPILLIIGYRYAKVAFGFYVWFQNKLYRYE